MFRELKHMIDDAAFTTLYFLGYKLYSALKPEGCTQSFWFEEIIIKPPLDKYEY